MGIDPDRFISTCKLPEVIQQMNELKEKFSGKKVIRHFSYINFNLKKVFTLYIFFWCWQVILGVDRLDMIKGIPQKYLGFEKFLEENPDWRDKVVLVQIAVPTRDAVPECKSFPLSSMHLNMHKCSETVLYLQIRRSETKFMDSLDALMVVLVLSLLFQFITWFVCFLYLFKFSLFNNFFFIVSW